MGEKLSLGKKIGYGIGDTGANVFFTIIAIWLMYYFTDVVGLDPKFTALAFLLGKLFDAVIDPAIGLISDKTKSKMGRRRPYILIGAFTSLITMAVLFRAPGLQGQIALFVWAIIAYFTACLAHSLIAIPYSSLTPELTTDYDEMTNLNGWRMFFAMIGTLLGAIVFGIIVKSHTKAPIDEKTAFSAAGIIFGFLILIVSLITFFSIKEKEITPDKEDIKSGKSIGECFKNKPYLNILLTWTFNVIGITLITAIQPYYFKYVLNREEAVVGSFVVIFFIAILFIPLWVFASKKIGKKNAYSLGLFLLVIGIICLFLFGHKMGIPKIFILIGFCGIGLSATFVCPWSMIPDTVEYDYVKTKKRKEGSYYGIWNFLFTLGGAFGGAILQGMLEKQGFVANAVQSEKALFGMRLALGPVPAFFLVIAAVIVLFYPLTKKKYEEVKTELDKM